MSDTIPNSQADALPSPEQLLKTAISAASAASAYAMKNRGRRHDANSVARNDIKLKLDVECQEIATRTILCDFPTHFILGEEDKEERSSPEDSVEWIIDPIDGTVNFFHGAPYWCCSVAARINGKTMAGCVCAPEMGLVFQASRGTPSLRNGERIRVSDTASADRSIIHTGADKSASPESCPFRFMDKIASVAQRPRIYGAAALDICMVACGAADAFFEPGIYIWDIAAADLILEEAGGRGTIMRNLGHHRLAYLGSNGRIHDEITAELEPMV